MKKCPYCAEDIQDAAIKCKHCSQMLSDSPPVPTIQPWYYRTTVLVIGFLCVGPLIVPLVWLNPRYSRATKIVITLVMLLLTWALVWSTAWLTSYLLELLKKNLDLLIGSV